MESARALIETPSPEKRTIVQRPSVAWPEHKRPVLIRVKRRLYQWEQMLLGELLALTLPATDFRRR